MIKLPPKVWLAIRLLFSAGLLWLAFRPIDWTALVQASQQLQVGWLLVALGLIVASNVLAACRWGWIMRRSHLWQPWGRYISLYFAGGLINQGIPSTLGGDTYRAIQSTHGLRMADGPALRYGLLAVALDRAMGLSGNIILGAIGLIIGGSLLIAWAPQVGWLLLIALVIAGLGIGLLIPRPRFNAFLRRALAAIRLPHGLDSVTCVFGWPFNVMQLIVAVSIHAINLTTFWACLKAYGVETAPEALMIGLPALGLLMMLPISISGWGLRETTLSAVLLLWAVPASTTVLASISYGLLVIVAYLPALWVLLRSKNGSSLSAATTIPEL